MWKVHIEQPVHTSNTINNKHTLILLAEIILIAWGETWIACVGFIFISCDNSNPAIKQVDWEYHKTTTITIKETYLITIK